MTTEPLAFKARACAPRLDNQDPQLFGQTPSQTIGPFFHYGLPWKGGADLVGKSDMGARADLIPESHYLLACPSPRDPPRGEVIEIAGRVLDARDEPVPDAMIEIWQANAAGRYASDEDRREDVPLDPAFVGWGRAAALADGEWRFRTVMPGRVPGPAGTTQAAHVAVSIFARGMLKRLATRIYFADGEGLKGDPVLAAVPEDRRETLIARRLGENTWWLDLRLSGEGETVFFAL